MREKKQYSPKDAKKTVLEISYNDEYIIVKTSAYHEGLGEILRDLSLSCNKEERYWQRKITERMGNIKDRIIEIMSISLANGYPIISDDEDTVYAAINEQYEPEHERWVLAGEQQKKDGTIEKMLVLTCPYSETMHSTIKRLLNAKYENKSYKVPLHRYEEVQAFADSYNFKFTAKARRFMGDLKARMENEEIQRVELLVEKMSKKRKRATNKIHTTTIEEVTNALKDD